jgi:hypothetical protein
MSGRRISMTVPQMRRCAITVSLQQQEALIVAFLLACPPDRFVAAGDHDLRHLGGSRRGAGRRSPESAIAVRICALRKMGIRIENDFGFGYRIPVEGRAA